VAANCALREHAVADFERLAHAETKQEFKDIWAKHHAEYDDQPAWLSYLAAQWYSSRQHWAMAWKQVCLFCPPISSVHSFMDAPEYTGLRVPYKQLH
jgi:hypothetical protein